MPHLRRLQIAQCQNHRTLDKKATSKLKKWYFEDKGKYLLRKNIDDEHVLR